MIFSSIRHFFTDFKFLLIFPSLPEFRRTKYVDKLLSFTQLKRSFLLVLLHVFLILPLPSPFLFFSFLFSSFLFLSLFFISFFFEDVKNVNVHFVGLKRNNFDLAKIKIFLLRFSSVFCCLLLSTLRNSPISPTTNLSFLYSVLGRPFLASLLHPRAASASSFSASVCFWTENEAEDRRQLRRENLTIEKKRERIKKASNHQMWRETKGK